MPDTGAPWNLPYPAPSDLVRDAPEAFEDLAAAVATGLTAAGAVKQVVYFTGGSSQSTTSTTFINTDITASITPGSTDSQILLFYSASELEEQGTNRTAIAGLFVTDKDGTQLSNAQIRGRSTSTESAPLAMVAAHSPGVTTAVTYMVCLRTNISDSTAVINTPNQLILVEVDI